MFQHRHYVELAKMVAKARERMAYGDFCAYVTEWVCNLQNTNPRFDAERFRTACMGVPVNKRDKACRTFAS